MNAAGPGASLDGLARELVLSNPRAIEYHVAPDLSRGNFKICEKIFPALASGPEIRYNVPRDGAALFPVRTAPQSARSYRKSAARTYHENAAGAAVGRRV